MLESTRSRCFDSLIGLQPCSWTVRELTFYKRTWRSLHAVSSSCTILAVQHTCEYPPVLLISHAA